jgi:hypothetical protein
MMRMAFEKVTYVDNQTVITADQMNKIQDAIIENRENISSLAGSGGLTITDDGEGNVTIAATGSAKITDDGNGNVTIL